MARRTPGLQTRSQYHAYWGVYTASTDLPNASGNPIGIPEFSKLENGDVAYVNDDDTRYVCVDPGTLSGGDAIWRAFAVGTDTIRDAHEIVVGFSSSPYNDDASDADFLDPGDGSRLRAALSEASSRGYPLDVRIRNGRITIPQGAGVITVPSNVRLIGAGAQGDITTTTNSGTLITGPSSGGDQQIFELLAGATLEELHVFSPAPTGATSGVSEAVVICRGGNQQILRCQFTVLASFGGATPRTQYGAVQVDNRDNVVIENCDFNLDDTFADEGSFNNAVQLFSAAGDLAEARVLECRVSGGDKGVFSTTDRVTVAGCYFNDMVVYGIQISANTSTKDIYRHYWLRENTIIIGSTDPGVTQIGIYVVTNAASHDMRYMKIEDNDIDLSLGVNVPVGIRVGDGAGLQKGPNIRGNNVDNGDDGIDVLSGSTDAIVLGNDVSTPTSGISDAGTLSEIAHNIT